MVFNNLPPGPGVIVRPKQLVRVVIARSEDEIFADYILNLVNMQSYKIALSDAHPVLMMGYTLAILPISEAEARVHTEIRDAHKLEEST